MQNPHDRFGGHSADQAPCAGAMPRGRHTATVTSCQPTAWSRRFVAITQPSPHHRGRRSPLPAVADPRTLAAFARFHDLLPDALIRLNARLQRTTFAPSTTRMSAEQPGAVA